jgi:DUF4097 and DUF4098 domain-containing protein YvlB
MTTMLTTLTSFAVLAAGPQHATDTVIPVPRDGRLAIEVLSGDLTIRAWNRSEMRVESDLGPRERLEVERSGSVVRLAVRARYGIPQAPEMTLTIPATMAVDIEGPFVEADIEGVESEVSVETVQGDVRLVGGRRFVKLQSVQGDVHVERARGRVELGSANGEVTAVDVAGEIVVDAVNGEITITGADAEAVRASTINGEISYDGALKDNGRYSFSAHNGDITVTVPPRTNATVTVSTFNGEFEADFPVTLTETRGHGKRFSFVMGNGSGRIELDSFGGTIKLVRP